METDAGVMSVYGGIGILGVAFYIGSYAALQFGLIGGRGYAYPALNGIAAALVAVSLVDAFNLSSLIIQVTWITISVFGILRIFMHRNLVKYNEEETRFLESMLPYLPKEHARPFLNLAEWKFVEPGEYLIQEDKPVLNLIFLLDGMVEARLHGETLAEVDGGHFLGEVTCMRGGPATASIVVTQRSRVLMIEVEALKKFLKMNGIVREHLERSFNSQMGQKLGATTRKLLVQKSEDKGKPIGREEAASASAS